MPDLGFQRRQLDAHRATDGHRTRGGPDHSRRRMSGGGHALAHLADHVGDVIADRTNHRATSAQRAAVIDQGLPFGQLGIRNRFAQTDSPGEPAPEGVLLLPDLAQRFELIDRSVFRIPGLGEKQAGLGTHAAMDTAAEERRRRCVDLLPEGVEAACQRRSAHEFTPR